jgi:putative methyltransferase (TIGR04325 family)
MPPRVAERKASTARRGLGARGAAKRLARALLPPVVIRAATRARARLRRALGMPAHWEYVPEGWTRELIDSRVKGWNVSAIVDAYKAKWPSFVAAIEGSGPLGVAHEVPIGQAVARDDPTAHNTIISFGYVLALAAGGKETVSILDWGGGPGHYYLISKALLPGVEIAYHSKDQALLCAWGRELFPEATFYDDDSCFEQSYDLVVASSSLQYSEDWCAVLRQLGQVANGYLYVSRLPVVFESPSFLVIQRPYEFGYDTEYIGWALNHGELLDCASSAGMRLVREFALTGGFQAEGAPEVALYRGFLFEPAS